MINHKPILNKYRVEFHWADIQDAEDHLKAIDKSLEVFLKDYQIQYANIDDLRGGLHASIIKLDIDEAKVIQYLELLAHERRGNKTG